MGRYAFFNTGLEYKFTFGIQDSMDITLFSGIGTHEEMGPFHEWTSNDIPFIQKKVETLVDHLGIHTIDISSYEKSLEGTYKLKDTLSNKADELHSRYTLGLLILHQLSYTDHLTVTYEL